MANTTVITHLRGPGALKDGLHVIHIHLISDGTNESNLVAFDNGDSSGPNNVLKGILMGVKGNGKCTGAVRLAWDQTTDFKAVSFNPAVGNLDLCDIGGIANPGGAGATGDLLLTTTGLASGDEFVLLIYIQV